MDTVKEGLETSELEASLTPLEEQSSQEHDAAQQSKSAPTEASPSDAEPVVDAAESDNKKQE